MKKFLLALTIILSVFSLAVLGACGERESTPPPVAPATYTVTFKQEMAEDKVFTINEGDVLDASQIPTVEPKSGYDGAWEEIDFSTITENVVVNAIYTPKTFTVTLDANGGTGVMENKQIIFDEPLALGTPKKDRLNFVGWFDKEGVEYESGDVYKYASDITLTAKWAYQLTFIQQARTDEILVEEGKTFDVALIPSLEQKTGYAVSWQTVDFSNINVNAQIEAVYTANTYTVTIDADGGVIDQTSVTVTFDSQFSLPIPTKEGFAFKGYFDGDNQLPIEGSWTTAKDVSVVALWETIPPKHYAVTFSNRGIVVQVFYVTEGEDFDLSLTPTLPSVDGYTVAWQVVDLTNLTEDKVVKAVYEPKSFTITLNADGGLISNNTVTVVYDNLYQLETPTRGYDKFLGWYDESGNRIADKASWQGLADITLTAKWQTVNVFKVTFRYPDGQVIKTVDVVEGEDLDESMRPTVDAPNGYSIAWSIPVGDVINVTEDLFVTANTVANQYTVTFDTTGGQVVAPQKFTFDAPYQLPTPVRDGYQFLGWLDGDDAVLIEGEKWNIFTDLTLTAKWGVEIKFDYGDGTVDTFVVAEGETFNQTIPTVSVKTGYDSKWSALPNGAITESMHITIVYTAKNYKVTFNADGGEVTLTEIWVTFDKEYQLESPTKDGYDFKGWFNGSTPVDAEGVWTTPNDVTLTAKWENKIKHAVTFTYLGDEIEVIYVEQGADFQLDNLPKMTEKVGYEFEWDISGDKLINVTEAKTVVGDYKAKTFTVTYLTNGGSVDRESDEVVYDGAYTLATPEKLGSTFMGWFNGDAEVAITADKWTIAEDLSLLAKWGHKVKFVQEGKTDTIIVESGGEVVDSQYPQLNSKEGYDVSWDDVDLSNVTSDVVVNAVYKPKTFVLTLVNSRTMQTISTYDVVYNEAYKLPTPTYLNYMVKLWKDESGTVVPSSGVYDKTSGQTLYAEWGYGIIFKQNNGQDDVVIVGNANSHFDAWFVPEREGASEFMGWYDENGSKIDTGYTLKLTQNFTLTAKWGYTVSFVSGNKAWNFLVEEGNDFDLSLMPKAPVIVGQQIKWEEFDLTNITENKTIRLMIYDTASSSWIEYGDDWSDFA